MVPDMYLLILLAWEPDTRCSSKFRNAEPTCYRFNLFRAETYLVFCSVYIENVGMGLKHDSDV